MGVIKILSYVFAICSIIFTTVSSQCCDCSTQKDRLLYHFSPNENWSNDPNGLVYYNGTYHLFFQYHPFSTQWGPMHWGHAISTDMLFWEELDIALYPDEFGTIYSGSAVVDWTNSSGFQLDKAIPPIVAIYTNSGGEGERQSIAYSNDLGMTFTKFSGNPVLSQPGYPDFRDPKVIKDRFTGSWTMVLVAGTKLEFYGSANLKEWVKLSELPWDLSTGEFECPDMIELPTENADTVWVLLTSVTGTGPTGGSGSMYIVGSWNGTTFTAFPSDSDLWWDWGPDNYAGVTWSNDPKNRTIAVGWMTNSAYSGSIPTTTWRGQYTLPRLLSIRTLNSTTKQYRIRSQPPEEIENLWNPGQHDHLEESEAISLAPGSIYAFDPKDFHTPLVNLDVTLELKNGATFQICGNNSFSEKVCFGLNGTNFYLDRTESGNVGFNDQFQRSSFATAKREIDGEIVSLRMFFDATSIEVFADDGLTAMTALYFPTEPFESFYLRHTNGERSNADAILTLKQYEFMGLYCTVKNKK